ncbi:O-methyltransferase [Flammeovirga aprica]|uniref:SAM-dependent methyltransferase n=1 Tax=Flammeovirga aprica JL-4 TaxID=694437 RepID=A0A7X9XCX4_9BACT|nr:class I SAM-dependent methyltransferase [Flammeovirga aprica]NME72074.1 SAM-dependent methyltransferase [Flammeovirga aprica JL-4]
MQVLDFIKYKFIAGNAHGLHSPFVYELYTQVIAPEKRYYIFDKIEDIRKELLENKKSIEVEDLGAGSKVNKQKNRKISKIASSSLCSPREGALLFELIGKYKYKKVLELGTSFGISTLYLSTYSKDIQTITIEGSETIANIAKENFKKIKNVNIELIQGNIDHQLPTALKKFGTVDVVYFDANHKYKPTMKYFEQCLPYIHENTLFIFDDIYWSKGMKKAWSEICKHPSVGISVDLYDMGLIFFRQKQPKQFFTLQNKPNE